MPVGVGGRVVVSSGRALAWTCRPDPVRHRWSHRPALPADLDPGQVERVEDQLDLPPDQGGVDFVGVAVQADRGGLGDGAPLRPQERLPQLRRRGAAAACSPTSDPTGFGRFRSAPGGDRPSLPTR
jgi:hypothetical protein